jgi:hypothetical protein
MEDLFEGRKHKSPLAFTGKGSEFGHFDNTGGNTIQSKPKLINEITSG